MSVQQTFIYGWAGQNGANPVTKQVVVDADGEDNRSIALGDRDAADVDLAWTAETLKGIYVSSDGAFTLTLNPNGSNPEEFTPEDGVPISWNVRSGLYYPFNSAAVTEVRLTAEQTDAQTVTIKLVRDTTVS